LDRLQRAGAAGLIAGALSLLLGISADGKVQRPVITEVPQPGEPAADLVLCEEPRPEMCAQEYDPVCASMKDGTRQTRPSGCSACSNPDVTDYEKGPCE
jgi:hypothetical protein